MGYGAETTYTLEGTMRSSFAFLVMSALVAAPMASAEEPAGQATDSTTVVVLVAPTPKPAPPVKMGER